MESLKVFDPNALSITSEQLRTLAPYMWVFGGACLALVCSLARAFNPKWLVAGIALISAILGIYSSGQWMFAESVPLFGGMMISDSFGHFFNVLFLSAAAISIMTSFKYLDREQLQYPEYYLLMLFSTIGMMLMASSLDLIVIFIALEIMSLAVYVLVGFRRADRRSNEASMKYFVMGSAASAILLYGSALLYGATGSLNIVDILTFTQSSAHNVTPIYHLGTWLVMTGFLFKVASVPFHMWMPDVYEGAPTPITGFMTTGIKAASFATLVRVFIGMGYGTDLTTVLHGHLHTVLWVCAAATMLFGNVIALTQTNLKRMLAYSSIAHTGYILVGVITATRSDSGWAPVAMYLLSYVVMNLGAFSVLAMISGRGDTGLNLQDLNGLSRKNPWLALALAVFLFSMAGIPPTAGFAAKYYLFYGAVQAGEIWLVVLGVLCSAISVYFYLRVIVTMFMRDPVGSDLRDGLSPWASFAVAMTATLTLMIGILPSNVLSVSRQAVSSLAVTPAVSAAVAEPTNE